MFRLRIVVYCLSIQFKLCLSSLSECDCALNVMICKNGYMPKYLPVEISALFVKHFDFGFLPANHLPTSSMIRKLDIEADKGSSIAANSFRIFFNSTYLGLHGKELRVIHKDAFRGLQYLLTLNLSSNPLLTFDHISSALNAGTRRLLPNLISLIVSNVKTSVGESAMLEEDFFRSIAGGRKLKYLDLSKLNIYRLNFTHVEYLCNSVEYFSVRNSVIGHTLDLDKVKPCTSLKTIDVSQFIVPALRIRFSFENMNFSCRWLRLFSPAEIVLFNDVNTMHSVRVNRYFLNMSACPLHLKKLYVKGNKIQWVNMTVLLHETTKKSLNELAASNNRMEYLSPSVLNPSENIRFLDLSNNKLNVMQEQYTTEFERLFRTQIKLESLNLSRNEFRKIPVHLFSTNKMLKCIDLSYNEISAIDFSIKQLHVLEKLKMSHNKIYTIGHDIRVKLQSIWSSSTSTDGNRNFHVYLEDNMFKCTCEPMNMKFIEWLSSTRIIDKTEKLMCNLDEDIVDIRDSAVQDTEHFCSMQKINKLAKIFTPIILVVVILSIVIVVIFKKRRDKTRLFRTVVAQIERGTYPLPFLAFLSYCSEDTDIVLNKIYPDLCENLSAITHSDASLACVGDKYFRPGFSIHDEVMRCVEDSSVFVAVISKNYCRKAFCNMEIGEAYDQRKPIIMLMIEQVEKELMEDFMRKIFDRYVHATWIQDDDGGHIEPEWRLFCKSIIQLAGKTTVTLRNNDRQVETAF